MTQPRSAYSALGLNFQIHYLKTWPTPFKATFLGLKPYEIREFDRDFNMGDCVVLDEYEPKSLRYTGRRMIRLITYLNPPGQWGLRGEVGVFGTKALTEFELTQLTLQPIPTEISTI